MRSWNAPFRFELDPELVRTDALNTLAVRVYDGANAGGIYKNVHLVEAKKPGASSK